MALGRFALERAATDLAHWQRYFPLTPPLVRQRQSLAPAIARSGFEALLRPCWPAATSRPARCNLEITESAVATDAETGADAGAAARRRARGCRSTISAPAPSTLSQFRTLPFDTVKIDKSFLARHGGTDIDTDGDVVLSSHRRPGA